jgi:hypothetical protein
MRPLVSAAFVIASGVLAGVLAPGGHATSATAGTLGDGCLVVKQGIGKVVVSLTRGVVFGRFDEGTVKFDDVVPSDNSTIKVFPAAPTKVTDTWTTYSGFQIRFRTSGALRISFLGQGLDLSAVGKGTALLSSAGLGFAGSFSVDAASFCQDGFQTMPPVATKFPVANPVTG